MADHQENEGRRPDPGYGDHGIRAGRPRHRPHSHGMVIAVLLIAAGALLFLDNIGLLHLGDIWRYWPVALIAIGAAKLFDTRGAGGRVWSAMMIALGTCFLLDNLDVWHFSWGLIWPLALVAAGILMLVNAVERKSSQPDPAREPSAVASSDDTLRAWAIFSGLKRRLDTQNFLGGDMLATFGGIEVDLRRANISPTRGEVVIDANATFGGIDLKVPETWLVMTRGFGLFGGYEDKTIPPKPQEGAPAPRLVVTGYAVFGGITVRN